MMTMTLLRRGAFWGPFLGLTLLLCAGSASAQLYKWVDASGKTHFSDTPPPETGKPAKIKGGAVGSMSATMPYALSSAMRSNPVTLYTTRSCASCDAGRSYLRGRGIPFNEKTVTTAADEARLRAVAGDVSLPLLIVGSNKSTGFQQSAWDAALSSAQYPATRMLPGNYQYPEPVAAAPVVAKPIEEERTEVSEEEAARAKALAPQTAPPGFRF